MNLSEEIVVGVPYKNPTVDEEDFPSKVGGVPVFSFIFLG